MMKRLGSFLAAFWLCLATPVSADPASNFSLLPLISAQVTTSQSGDGIAQIGFQSGTPPAPIDLTGIKFDLQWHPANGGVLNPAIVALSAGQYLANGGPTGVLTLNIPRSRLRTLPPGTYVASLVASLNGATSDLGVITITHSAIGPSNVTSLSTTQRNAATATSIGYVPGPQGLSAYQVAVANGFTGTQAQWLASLAGPAGAPGTSYAIGTTPGTVAAGNDYRLQNAPLIGGNGSVSLLNGPTLGTYQNGQFTSQPYNIQLGGPGSTGDASTLCVKAVGSSFCRAQSDRAKDIINAADYFTCDGTTPIDAALQGVFNLAATLKSPIVNLPPGICVMNATVNLTVAATVQGAGMSAGPGAVDYTRGTVLLANFKDGDVINATSLYGFTFRDFQINSNVGFRTSGGGIHINVPSGGSGNGATKIERVATNNQYIGLWCTNCLLTEISGTYHQAWTRSAYYADGNAANEANGGYLHHNWFEGDSRSTSTQVAAIESHVGYIRVSHNLFVGALRGVSLQFDIRGAGSSVITDNTLENCAYDCISVANANGVTANNLQISRNEFMATGADSGPYIANFIHIIANNGGTGPYITNVQINENTMVGQFTSSGVVTYMNISSGDNVSINDNTIQHMGGDTAYGILINSEPTRVSIKNLRETGTSTHAKYFIGNTDTQIADMQGLPFASLPAAANGSCIYVPDGATGPTFNAAVAGGGTGAFAGRLNGAWVNHC